MDQTLDTLLGFAPDYDSPIPYMRRTREYYAAIGYTTPYRWAHYLATPFAALRKPLATSKVAIVTTAAPYQPDKGDQGPGAPYNGSAKFYQVYSGDTSVDHDLRISHIGYDRTHTTATDSGTWFPLPALRRAAAAGRIGAVAARFHGAPTNRSHRVTMETDAPEILRRVREDEADVVVVVPNCPVCHQTSTLVARHLEANGVPTVLMGCAKDIVEHAGAPRFLFSDFPLGNSAGKPHEVASQDQTLNLALHLLETAPGPQTTMQSPLRWNADGTWKLDYLNLEQIGEAELKRRREEFDRQKELARPNRVVKGSVNAKASEGRRPFQGVRILDFTQVLAGPYASYQLALLGADVIKIERRGGEDMRRTPLSREWADRNMASAFIAVNGNKKSLTLDLQKPAAREILLKLAAKADVVMENFRAGVMDRLGLGYEALSAVNPKLIYCAISGFGQTGPASNEAGYDGKIQAMSGIMAITGHPETGPTRAGFAVCDILSGATGAFAISSALFQRTHTGIGQLLDVSMLEASLSFLTTQVADYTVAGHHQQQAGNQAVSRKVTANLFKAKDSYLLLAVNDEKQYRALMTGIGRTEVFDDSRFTDWFQRKAHEAEMREIIESALAAEDSKIWERRLNDAGAPCASIWKVEEIIDHPQIVARGAVQTVESQYGPLRLMGSGFQMAHGGGKLDTLAPEAGADTDAVLAEIGYDEATIAALRTDGVI